MQVPTRSDAPTPQATSAPPPPAVFQAMAAAQMHSEGRLFAAADDTVNAKLSSIDPTSAAMINH